MNMFKPNLPTVTTLESDDDDQLAAELRLARLRTEVAVVRTLADQVEVFVSSRHAARLSEQLTEEMAKLGCLLFEAAAGRTSSGVRRGVEDLVARALKRGALPPGCAGTDVGHCRRTSDGTQQATTRDDGSSVRAPRRRLTGSTRPNPEPRGKTECRSCRAAVDRIGRAARLWQNRGRFHKRPSSPSTNRRTATRRLQPLAA
jgi:hypothetical protein